MSLPTSKILRKLVENIFTHKLPIPVPVEACNSWAYKLNIPKGGSTILYTSCLYQLVPYINKYLEKLEQLEGRSISRLLIGIGETLKIQKLLAPSKSEVSKINSILEGIAWALKRTGVEYGYLYDDEVYCGALLCELGFEDTFSQYCSNVYRVLKKHNVKKVITIDPHTTYTLREIYPKFIDDFDLEVVNYLELLDTLNVTPKTTISKRVVFHDPCFYARYEDIIEQPRRLLSKGECEIVEPIRSKKLTFCCGGPIEILTPTTSKHIGLKRLEELKSYSRDIVVSCPICYAVFLRASKPLNDNINIIDTMELIAKIYGGYGGK